MEMSPVGTQGLTNGSSAQVDLRVMLQPQVTTLQLSTVQLSQGTSPYCILKLG